MRWAWIWDGNWERVERFLPHNYKAVIAVEDATLICGEDDRGWTLDDYVIPRLASGLIAGDEIKDRTVVEMLNGIWGDA